MTPSRGAGDVVVIGAGLIGLSIAFELARSGATVRVMDSGEPGKAASWAGAGMLAPLTEQIADSALQRLCEQSLVIYPEYVDSIREVSGVDPKLHLNGVLSAAFDNAQMGRLDVRAEQLSAEKYACRIYDRDETLSLEPALSKAVRGSLLVGDEGQIDNRRLGRALQTACERQGVTLHANIKQLSVECDARRVLGVRTDVGFVPADAVVNAAGAWSSQIGGVPPNCIPAVRPVKGQMLTIETPKSFVTHPCWFPGGYAVPRDDGRLLIGATVEDVGFDTRVTSDGLRSLLNAALDAMPALGSFSVSETWAGVRPGTPDGRPFLGATPLVGYFLATGHYRNGILLAPITARYLADAIEGKRESTAFSIERPSPFDRGFARA
ncbi:MAG: glycine oxidase ThiO [Candidatus Eremiobacteraeota bacterium]|nr:glycine oxidase ThiO [Candidatus Eremiobacteraeota bacterium]